MSSKDGKVLSDMPIGESVDAVKLEGGQAFASTAGAQLFGGDRVPLLPQFLPAQQQVAQLGGV